MNYIPFNERIDMNQGDGYFLKNGEFVETSIGGRMAFANGNALIQFFLKSK